MKNKIESCSDFETRAVLIFLETNVFLLKLTSILISFILNSKICYKMEKLKSKQNIISLILACGK